jgi:DNA polymerase-3 subunit alpha
MGSIDNIVKFVGECRAHAIPVLAPDVNAGFKQFTVDRKRIRFGLVAVKNVGESAIDAIIEARQNAPFTSLFDFCERVDPRRVNKRVVESLIKCGAFDSTGARRSQLMAALEVALDHGQRVQREKCDPQMGLFGGIECPAPVNAPAMPDVEEWDDRQKLAFEKESLGFYLSGHPLTRYEELLSKFTTTDAISIKEAAAGAVVRIGGLVRGSKTIKTKKGDLMGFVTIEDRHGAVEVTVFSRLFAVASDLLVEGNALLIQGQVQKDEQSVKLVADTLIPLTKAEETWTASVHVNLELSRADRQQLLQLRDVLQRYPGSCKAYLHLRSPGQAEAVIELPEGIHLKAGAALRREVSEVLGDNALETRCAPM